MALQFVLTVTILFLVSPGYSFPQNVTTKVQESLNNSSTTAVKTINSNHSDTDVELDQLKAFNLTHSFITNDNNSKTVSNYTARNDTSKPVEAFIQENKTSSNGHCPPFFFPCYNSSACFPLSKVCNNVTDCPDQSDESESLCQTQDLELIVCHNGQILTGHNAICNNVTQCNDGSDEIDCKETTPKICDSVSEFACHDKNNTCVDNSKKCDGRFDCENGLDEMTEFCSLWEFLNITFPFTFHRFTPFNPPDSCAFRCDNGRCLPANYVCDGFRDCLDESDEMGCFGDSLNLNLGSGFYKQTRFIVLLSIFACSIIVIITTIIYFGMKKRRMLKANSKRTTINANILSNQKIPLPPSYEQVVLSNADI